LLSFAHLAALRHKQGRLSEAEDLLRHVLSVQNQAIGARHPHTLACQASLGRVLEEAGRFSEAEAIQREVLALRTEVLGQSHVDTLATAHALATCLMAQGHHASVLPMVQRTQSLALRSLPKGHVFLADIQAQLGCCLAALERFDDAEKALTQAYEQMRSTRGLVHATTQEVLRALIGLYGAWGKPHKAAPYRAAHATCS
jgi:tetratricopeptide (TPR) repeat protein